MDNVAASRRNHTSKKGNKENTQPTNETKSFIKRGVLSKAPLQPKGKDGTSAKSVPLKSSAKQTDGKLTSAVAVKHVPTLKKVGKAGGAPHSHDPNTNTTQPPQARKVSAEAPQRPAAEAPQPSTKPALGMYKGRVIQSKIGSIWKSSSSLNSEDPGPSAPKMTNQRAANLTKSRVTPAAGCGMKKPGPHKVNSVAHGATRTTSRPPTSARPPPRVASARPPPRVASAHAPTGVTSARPPTGVTSARPPTGVTFARPPTGVTSAPRTVPTAMVSRNASAGPTKRSGTVISKPRIPATEQKVSRPPVCSSLSQYRRTTESDEQKQAKLAEWLASKGRSLKRPAMVSRPATKTKPSVRPEDRLKPKPEPEPEPEPEPSLDAPEPSSTSADEPTQNQEQDTTTKKRTPDIMNTTLDLLENSDLSVELVDGVDDIVINLCEALEAMETPSCCREDPPQVKDEYDDVEIVDELKDESEQEELKDEDVGEKKSEETDEKEVEDSRKDVDGAMAAPVQDGDDGARASPVQGAEGGAMAAPVQDADDGAMASPVQDAESGARASPVQDADGGARASPVQDSDDDAMVSPVQDADDEVMASPVQDSDDDATASSVQDSDDDAMASPVQDADDGARASPVQDSDDDAMASPVQDADDGARASPVQDSDDDAMASPVQDSDDGAMASVVKYSVKTTPYLQSLKKATDEAAAGSSRRKSNINDVKYLTPVRRSSRIHRMASRLPAMLVDHDPCVSSLAELVKMDDNPNAYIYRKNPVLLDELPDEARV